MLGHNFDQILGMQEIKCDKKFKNIKSEKNIFLKRIILEIFLYHVFYFVFLISLKTLANYLNFEVITVLGLKFNNIYCKFPI